MTAHAEKGEQAGFVLTEEMMRFLEEPRFAVVATINRDGTPHQSVVWYRFSDSRLMMNTAVGRRKERNLRRDPRISFCIEDGYRYLTLNGYVKFDDDRQRAQADIYALAIRYDGEQIAEERAQNTFRNQRRATLYMVVTGGFSEGF